MGETMKHLVVMRHGFGEGDQRRDAEKNGIEYVTTGKTPKDEELTGLGFDQSRKTGKWVMHEVFEPFGFTQFDGCYVSNTVRCEQSAVAMELPGAVWQVDTTLDERNRGLIAGMKRKEQEIKYPETFQLMKDDPLHCTPPRGEALIPDLELRIKQFHENIDHLETVIAVGHRDWIWIDGIYREGLNETQLVEVDTDAITNGMAIHMTSLDPSTGEQSTYLRWLRTYDPTTDITSEWRELPYLADRFSDDPDLLLSGVSRLSK